MKNELKASKPASTTPSASSQILFSKARLVMLLVIVLIVCAGIYGINAKHTQMPNLAVTTVTYGCNGMPSSLPALTLGSQGNCVKYAQALLNQDDHAGLPINGTFDQQTYSAVINFQNRLSLSPNGTINYNTWEALITAY